MFITKSYGQHHKRVVILLGGWNNGQVLYWLPAQLFKLAGYHCIVYTYNSSVLSPDTRKTLTSLSRITHVVLTKIAQLKKQGYGDFSLFGFSLGATIGIMVANNSPDVKRLVLNLTGAHPAEAVWEWTLVKTGFKQALLDQKFTLNKLRHTWDPIAPINNSDRLSGKKILVYLAKTDKIIPYQQGLDLVKHFKQCRYNYHLKTNNFLGHVPAGLTNLLKFWIYLRFLKS